MRRVLSGLMAFILTAVLITSAVFGENIYSLKDVKRGSWYYNAVNYLVTNDIMPALIENQFVPDEYITKIDFISALYRAVGKKDKGEDLEIADVQATDSRHGAVQWAVNNAIVSLDENGCFYPEDRIQRQNVMVMFYNTAIYLGKFGEYRIYTGSGLYKYKDCNEVSDYAKIAMEWGIDNSLISGNGDNIYPKESISRAEGAQLLARFIDLYIEPGAVDWGTMPSINHTGYSEEAPENTLAAFEKSIEHEFDTIETDVRFTSDGVAVLLHDRSINRTGRYADGSIIEEEINIDELTFEQAQQYDYGIYKGNEFAGTKLNTFSELLDFCKNKGIKAYVEVKNNSPVSDEQIAQLVKSVEDMGLEDNITWISYGQDILEKISEYDPDARLGLVVDEINERFINRALALQNGENYVFIDSLERTEEACQLCEQYGLPMEVWIVDTIEEIQSMSPYISGVTSDNVVADDYVTKTTFNEIAGNDNDKRAMIFGIAVIFLLLSVLIMAKWPPSVWLGQEVEEAEEPEKIREVKKTEKLPKAAVSEKKDSDNTAQYSVEKIKEIKPATVQVSQKEKKQVQEKEPSAKRTAAASAKAEKRRQAALEERAQEERRDEVRRLLNAKTSDLSEKLKVSFKIFKLRAAQVLNEGKETAKVDPEPVRFVGKVVNIYDAERQAGIDPLELVFIRDEKKK